MQMGSLAAVRENNRRSDKWWMDAIDQEILRRKSTALVLQRERNEARYSLKTTGLGFFLIDGQPVWSNFEEFIEVARIDSVQEVEKMISREQAEREKETESE